jgi:hemoglobin-like flavoprotein
MTSIEIQLVKQSWEKVAALDHVFAGGLFYNRLFETAPHLRLMFRAPIDQQSRKLLTMINYIIKRLDKLETILDEVAGLARSHVNYGVKEEHYQLVGDALLWTLEQALGADWTPDVNQSWQKCYGLLSTAMIGATTEQRA